MPGRGRCRTGAPAPKLKHLAPEPGWVVPQCRARPRRIGRAGRPGGGATLRGCTTNRLPLLSSSQRRAFRFSGSRARLDPRPPPSCLAFLQSCHNSCNHGRLGMAMGRADQHDLIQIVQWHAEPLRYIANALGLSYVPSAVIYPVRRRADILLGDIDYPAARGRRAVNMLLTSALTSWQVRVKQISRSPNWHALQSALADKRRVLATVVGLAPRGLRVQVYGLNALLPFGQISRGQTQHSARSRGDQDPASAAPGARGHCAASRRRPGHGDRVRAC